VNATQSAILRALSLSQVLDVEHTTEEVHQAFRAVRHELETLQRMHCPQAPVESPELRSAHTGRATRPGSLRHSILTALSAGPMADFQVTARLQPPVRNDAPSAQLVRRRRHELSAAGWVEPVLAGREVRKVKQESTGRDCTVYQLTDWGVKALRRLQSGQTALFSTSELVGND